MKQRQQQQAAKQCFFKFRTSRDGDSGAFLRNRANANDVVGVSGFSIFVC